MTTLYNVLGAARNASEETIRRAFRNAVKACHPDVNAGDPTAGQRLREVITAYDVLKRPEHRAAYDQHLRKGRREKVWRFAAPPVAALVSVSTVALGVWLSSAPPQISHIAAAEAGKGASHQVADDGARLDSFWEDFVGQMITAANRNQLSAAKQQRAARQQRLDHRTLSSVEGAPLYRDVPSVSGFLERLRRSPMTAMGQNR